MSPTHTNAAKQQKRMSLVNLLPPQGLPPVALGQRRTSRTASSRPSTAVLEPLVSGSNPPEKKKVVSSTSKRPQSGNIRPLSSRVYMRRTVKNGWVAKGIHEEDEEEADNDDRLSDTGSLDSFFDDDFDNTPQSQVLEGFLSCNTLGVESKSGKNDWVAGDVAIPRFHCPRCRDHWYGLSSFPCDDELARLIREGKWYTGKEGNPIQQDSIAKTRNQKTDTSSSVTGASNSSSRLPSIRKRVGTGINRGNSDRNMDFINPHAKDKKKSRRISFKLDGQSDNDLTNSGSSGLLHDEHSKLRNGKNGGSGNGGKYDKSSTDESANRAGARQIESSSSASDVNSGSSTTLLRGSGDSKGNKDQLDGLDKKGGRKGDGSTDSSNVISTTGKKDLSSTNSKGGQGNGGKIDSSDSAGRGPGTASGKDQYGRGLSGTHSSDMNSQNGGKKNGDMGDDRQDGLGSRFGNKGGNVDSNGSKGDVMVDKDGKGKGGGKRNHTNDQNSSRFSSRTNSLNGGSQRWSEYGEGDDGKGKGRDLVAGKGYMRASSPSQSDWGDPTHAKAWLSNTASSSRVSLSNQSRKDKEDNMDVEEIFLPPIKNPPNNPFSSYDLMDGFKLTRAFSFSYH